MFTDALANYYLLDIKIDIEDAVEHIKKGSTDEALEELEEVVRNLEFVLGRLPKSEG